MVAYKTPPPSGKGIYTQMTDEGWAQAWDALVELDPEMAEKVVAVLARRAEEDHDFAERGELDARSLAYLPRVIFIGGYFASSLTRPRCDPRGAAQFSATGVGDNERQPDSGSPVDELSKLAGMLNSGLLAQEEFDKLKAKLIAEL
jgi:hypothetical protein